MVSETSGIIEWDYHSDDEDEERLMDPYQGVAFPVACHCGPILIPSDSEIGTHHLEAIRHRPTFLIAIWKRDGTEVTPVPHAF